MSTLDVACERCEKRFRVRAEFAGKTTRCPGCSAPMTIGGARPARSPREEPVERPRPRARPRDDEDDRLRRPMGDWRPVDAALGREQVAVLCALGTVVCSFCAFCLSRAAGAMPGSDAGVMVLALLFVVGPSLLAGGFGTAARVAALRAPAESQARGSAVSSLVCAIVGLAAVLVFGLSLLASIENQHGPAGFLPVVATTGLVLSGLGAIGTFAGFVAQVGIARRSAVVSAALGRAAGTACVAVAAVTALSLLLAVAIEATVGSSGRSYHEEEAVSAVLFGILVPLAFAAVLVAYHRLLGAARRAVRDEAG
jgi:hypothetical protein